MRFFAPLLAFAAAAWAQSSTNLNAINTPSSGFNIKVGSNTITWSNPSNGTVTLKLQQGSNITPTTGYTLASRIPASAQTATFTIPGDVVNTAQYTIEIIIDASGDYNFSGPFVVQGATGTNTGFPSSTGTATASTSTNSSASITSSSRSLSSLSASSTSSSSSASSRSSSASSTSSAATSSTSMPSSGAGNVKAQGGLVALLAGAVMFL